MKRILLFYVTSVALSLSLNSYIVKKDNGKHKGWTKNPHNPHHPASTNPGKAKGAAKPAAKKK